MSEIKAPYISVIIVAYNYADFLPRALNACARQTFRDFEIVLVNNGSTDNTQEVIDAFVANNLNLNIKTVNVEVNQGLAHGRNVGVNNSSGMYLLFNDADDWMDDNCLEVLAKASENGKYDRICAQYRDVAPDGKIIQIRDYKENISKWYITMIQASLFKRSLFFENNIIVPPVFSDDYYISININAHAVAFKVVCETVYNYFVNELSNSGARAVKEPERVIKMLTDGIDMTVELKDVISDEDYQLLEYQLIKFYYFHILHYNRYNTYANLCELYNQMHDEMLKYNRGYLGNKTITLFKDNGDRFYGRCITFFLSWFERTRTIKILLWLYLLVSKHYFLKV